jgi:hypothetical protein
MQQQQEQSDIELGLPSYNKSTQQNGQLAPYYTFLS